jgi:hypothetical protein
MIMNEKKGTLCFINIFTDKGQIRFEDETYEWFTPEDLAKGQVTKHV